jgi:hypothetical protein
MTEIQLSPTEIKVACMVGTLRRQTSKEGGMRDRAGRPNDWSADIEGAAGEIALAKYLGIYYEPTNKTFELPDVGVVEVKTSTRLMEIPIPPTIPDDRIVCGVFGLIPDFRIGGWIMGAEAKKFRLVVKTQGYPPAHWIPIEELAPAVELQEMVQTSRKEP